MMRKKRQTKNKLTSITLALDVEVVGKLDEQAARKGMSLENYIIGLLKKSLRKEEKAEILRKEEVDEILRKQYELEEGLKKIDETNKLV